MLDSTSGNTEISPRERDSKILASKLAMMTELPPEDSKRLEIESFWRAILNTFEERSNNPSTGLTTNILIRTDKFGRSTITEREVSGYNPDVLVSENAFEIINDLFHESMYEYVRSNGKEIDYRDVLKDPRLEEKVTDFSVVFWNNIASNPYGISCPTRVRLTGGNLLEFEYNDKKILSIQKNKPNGDVRLVAKPAFRRDNVRVELDNAGGTFAPLMHSLVWHNIDTAIARPSEFRSPNVRIIQTHGIKLR